MQLWRIRITIIRIRYHFPKQREPYCIHCGHSPQPAVCCCRTHCGAGHQFNGVAQRCRAQHQRRGKPRYFPDVVVDCLKKIEPGLYFGYKKTTILAALVNAVILLVAIGIMGYESATRLLVKPEAVHGSTIAWVAGLGIVINTVSALLFYRQQKNELNARSAYLHLMADALVSLGVVISGIVISYTDWYWLDPAVGLVVMLIILISTWGLLRDSFKMSVDAVPSGIELDNIKQQIAAVKDVTGVHHVHVWALSTTENALTAHVLVNDALTFPEKMAVVQHIKHELHHCNIQHSTIELESSETASGH